MRLGLTEGQLSGAPRSLGRVLTYLLKALVPAGDRFCLRSLSTLLCPLNSREGQMTYTQHSASYSPACGQYLSGTSQGYSLLNAGCMLVPSQWLPIQPGKIDKLPNRPTAPCDPIFFQFLEYAMFVLPQEVCIHCSSARNKNCLPSFSSSLGSASCKASSKCYFLRWPTQTYPFPNSMLSSLWLSFKIYFPS